MSIATLTDKQDQFDFEALKIDIQNLRLAIADLQKQIDEL